MNGVPAPVDLHPGPFDFNGDPIWHCQYKDANGKVCGQLCEVAISTKEKNAGKQYHRCNAKDPLTNQYHNWRKWKMDREEPQWNSNASGQRSAPGGQQSAQTVHTQSAQVAGSALMELAQKVELIGGAVLEHKDQIRELIQLLRTSLAQPKPGQATTQALLPVAQGALPPFPYPGGSGYANAGMAGASPAGAPTPGNSPGSY